jgi:hypothetical protein
MVKRRKKIINNENLNKKGVVNNDKINFALGEGQKRSAEN